MTEEKTILYPSTHEEERDLQLEREHADMRDDYTTPYDSPFGRV